MDRVWQCHQSAGDASVKFTCFDDDDFAIVFDPVSGDTHLVGYLSYLLFSMLSEKQRTFPDLLAYFLARFPDEDTNEVEALLKGSLEELGRCRLIVSAAH